MGVVIDAGNTQSSVEGHSDSGEAKQPDSGSGPGDSNQPSSGTRLDDVQFGDDDDPNDSDYKPKVEYRHPQIPVTDGIRADLTWSRAQARTKQTVRRGRPG